MKQENTNKQEKGIENKIENFNPLNISIIIEDNKFDWITMTFKDDNFEVYYLNYQIQKIDENKPITSLIPTPQVKVIKNYDSKKMYALTEENFPNQINSTKPVISQITPKKLTQIIETLDNQKPTNIYGISVTNQYIF